MPPPSSAQLNDFHWSLQHIVKLSNAGADSRDFNSLAFEPTGDKPFRWTVICAPDHILTFSIDKNDGNIFYAKVRGSTYNARLRFARMRSTISMIYHAIACMQARCEKK